MRNINKCSCVTVNRLRQHHGVVCTTCNPNKIEKLVVPSSITAYRVWKFSHQNAFQKPTQLKRGWSEFNDVLPPGFGEESDFMKPWSGASHCLHINHKAPNPYCSCGFYSINTFGKDYPRSFSHDGTDNIVRDFDRMLSILERYDEDTQKSILELLFYSPVAKTLEIQDFSLLGEVELTGTIIECELGYRSEYVTPKKMFLLLNIDKLYQITSLIGKKLNKDEAEMLHTTYQWMIYIDNYMTNMMKLFDLDFELRFKYTLEQLSDYEMLTGDQTKNSEYLPLRDHPLMYTKVRYISEVMKESNKFLYFKHPSLEIILEKLRGDSSNIAYLDRSRNNLGARYRRNRWLGSPTTLGQHMKREHIAEFFENYADYLLSFAHFNCMLGEQKNDKFNFLTYPNLSELLGFRYHTYLEKKYSANEALDETFISKEHPSLWFKNIYPYFEQYLEKIGRNSMPKYQRVNFDER